MNAPSPDEPSAAAIITKTVIAHTVTYFLVGVAAYLLFDYARLYAETPLRFFMRPTTDRWVVSGPLFQPLRGLLFGCLFVHLRPSFFGRNRDWRSVWLMLVIVGIIATFGPSPGSLEGVIYTQLPLPLHLKGLPETLLQSALLAFIVVHWVRSPRAKAINWIMGTLFTLVLLMSAAAVLSPRT